MPVKRIVTVHRFPPKVMNGCMGKQRHPTQGKALAAKRALERLDEREGAAGGEVKAYFCVRCKSWHVGHVRNG